MIVDIDSETCSSIRRLAERVNDYQIIDLYEDSQRVLKWLDRK